MVQIAFSRFKDFLKGQYPLYECNIKPEFITKNMMIQFVDYLQSRSVGKGAKSIYRRFKKVICYAIDHDVILKDSCKKNFHLLPMQWITLLRCEKTLLTEMQTTQKTNY